MFALLGTVVQPSVLADEISGDYLDISAAEAQQLLNDENQGIFLLDVRTVEEFTAMSISGAYLIPYDELQERSTELPSDLDTTIIVYCASGGRSVIASETLVELGYTNVMNMVGGISAWTEYIYSCADIRYLEGEERDNEINTVFQNEKVQILLYRLESMMYYPIIDKIITQEISYHIDEVIKISIIIIIPFENSLDNSSAFISFSNQNGLINISATTVDHQEATLFMTDYIISVDGVIEETSSSVPMSFMGCDDPEWVCVVSIAVTAAGVGVAGCTLCTLATLGLCLPCFLAIASLGLTIYTCDWCNDPPTNVVVPSPYPYVPGATGGCPYIGIWDGSEYLSENSILTDSENNGRESLEVLEYYKLQGTPVLKDGNYSFVITEFENHHTLLDQVEMLTIDHDDSVDIEVSRDGGIYTISDSVIFPNSAIDKLGYNRLGTITGKYDAKFVGYPGDFLELNFGPMSETSSAKLIFRSDIKPGGDISPISIDPLYDPYLSESIDNLLNFDMSGPIQINVKNNIGELTHVTDIYPRDLWATDIIDLTSYLPIESADDLIINLSWDGRHDLDYVALDLSGEILTEINQYQISDAEVMLQDCGCSSGCANENLRSTLLSDDGWYADKLTPGKQIEITFPYNEMSESMVERDIVFIFKGFYKELMNVDVSSNIFVEISQDSVDSITAYFVEWDGTEYDLIDTITTEPTGPSSANIVRHPQSEDLLFIEYSTPQPIDTYSYTHVNVEITSILGTENIEVEFTPSDGLEQTMLIPLKYEFDDVTGLSYNVTSELLTANSGAMPLEFEIYPEPRPVEYFDLINVQWKFGDDSYSSGLTTSHSYTSTGLFYANGFGIYQNVQGEDYSFTMVESAWCAIEIVNEFPIPEIEVYEVVEISLEVAGRKGNTVTLEVYEDGNLISQLPVTRTSGFPDQGSMTLNKYLDRTYELKLVYNAEHMGINNAWLILESGDNRDVLFFDFESCTGKQQDVVIDVNSIYLETVTLGNTEYFFDASNSYDVDGEIVSYYWDFGDGNTATGILVSHTYELPGSYTVSLTVIDNEGAIGITSYTL